MWTISPSALTKTELKKRFGEYRLILIDETRRYFTQQFFTNVKYSFKHLVMNSSNSR